MRRLFIGVESTFQEVLQDLGGDCVLSLNLTQLVALLVGRRRRLMMSVGRGRFGQEGGKADAACRMREDQDWVVSRFLGCDRSLY